MSFYNPNRVRVTKHCGPIERTKQSFKKECDVNNIVKTFNRTGILPSPNQRQPTYGDFSAAMELQEAINLSRQAQEDFAKLPSRIRELCGNSAVTYLEMLADEGAMSVLEKAGYRINKPEPAKTDPAGGGGNATTQTAAAPSPSGVSQTN